MKESSPMPTVIDLFCGAGGLSLGFSNAGFQILAGVDVDKFAIATHKANFPSSEDFLEDLTNPSPSFQSWLAGMKGKVDIVVGGPPCQGFSISGKRDPEDPRNRLYEYFLAVVRDLNPRAVLIENVPNISAMKQGAVKNAIIRDLEELGFAVKVSELLASDFGVPQNRRRIFFIGVKSDVPFFFPTPSTLTEKVTTEAALSDLPPLDGTDFPEGHSFAYEAPPTSPFQKEIRAGSVRIVNHELVRHTSQTREIIALVPDGGNYKNLPEELRETRRVNIAWTRMNSKKPCFTIDAGHNHHFHYTENRVPSVRECARIQSFPDRFVFLGTRTSQYRQVGNAVPPLLAEAIAREIRKVL